MKPPEPDANDNQIIGLSAAPEILVEGFRGVMTRAGVVKLNFFALRFDPALERVEKHAALTLAIPLADFADIAQSFGTILRDMQEKGALPKDGHNDV